MLRITIDLIPNGNEALQTRLGVMTVSRVTRSVAGRVPENATYTVVEFTGTRVRQWRAIGVTRFRNVFQFLEDLFVKKSPAPSPETKGVSQ